MTTSKTIPLERIGALPTNTFERDYPLLQQWPKCCNVCAFRKDQSSVVGESRVQHERFGRGFAESNGLMFVERNRNDPFECVHRTDEFGGKHICAAYAAIYKRIVR